jgi:hypothetical protein
MTGRSRLPGGEPRKASQRNKRNVGSPSAKITPVRQANMPVLWKGRAGVFRRDVERIGSGNGVRWKLANKA